MINKKDMEKSRKKVLDYDSEREKLIKKSRDVLKLSKQIIYAVHRDELKDASELIKKIENEKQKLEEISKHSRALIFEGSYKVAMQEYAEALLYYGFIKEGRLLEREELKIRVEHYLLGLCDLPGELVRKAVFLAGKKDIDSVIKIKELVDQIYGELLKFDFREHEIRRKFDSVKYDLRKLEDLVLDLRLKG
jgi:predicted translin family RNA/ssDNA-binding protein